MKNSRNDIIILSNYRNMANLTYKYFKNDKFFELCTGIVISAHEHIKKPDEKIEIVKLYNSKSKWKSVEIREKLISLFFFKLKEKEQFYAT